MDKSQAVDAALAASHVEAAAALQVAVDAAIAEAQAKAAVELQAAWAELRKKMVRALLRGIGKRE